MKAIRFVDKNTGKIIRKDVSAIFLLAVLPIKEYKHRRVLVSTTTLMRVFFVYYKAAVAR